MFYHDDLISQPSLDMARLHIGLPESTGILTSSESMPVSVLDVQQSLSGGLENKTIVLYDLGFDPVDRWVGERWRRIYAKAYEPQ
ncbi:hypothetical protein BOTNAR_0349g00020 [Botryotinia narcissicola]|uniref:Uncharacterized protein n=1 Tax=Botryotinia narcissicola TaxID=278944 RepID=A0A4Z1HS63_9HELO|nr:hypothetical protein BOTNAR_0349g00020 [Botryotinia narcissicola]